MVLDQAVEALYVGFQITVGEFLQMDVPVHLAQKLTDIGGQTECQNKSQAQQEDTFEAPSAGIATLWISPLHRCVTGLISRQCISSRESKKIASPHFWVEDSAMENQVSDNLRHFL
jgi:hypothetical protein